MGEGEWGEKGESSISCQLLGLVPPLCLGICSPSQESLHLTSHFLQSFSHVAAGVFILKSVISTACGYGPCSVKVRVLSVTHSPHGLVPDISPQFFLYSTQLTLTAAIMSHWPVSEWA